MVQGQVLRSNAKSKEESIALNLSDSPRTLAKSGEDELRKDIVYFSQLYSRGEISKKAFESLVEKACQLFVEVEIERRLSTYLERKIIRLLDKLTSELDYSDTSTS